MTNTPKLEFIETCDKVIESAWRHVNHGNGETNKAALLQTILQAAALKKDTVMEEPLDDELKSDL